MEAINLSLFEFYKSGPGPSSSHTIGPMAAGLDFRRRLEDLPPEILDRAVGLKATLYGSLSATGQGHGTDRALSAGLMGLRPESLDSGSFAHFWDAPGGVKEIKIRDTGLAWSRNNIEYGPVVHGFPFANTLRFELLGPEGPLYGLTYYSVGGGFIQWEGYQEPDRGQSRYPYGNMADLRGWLARVGISLPDLMMANEQALTGASRDEINGRLDRILAIMLDSVKRGLAGAGVLPGPIGLGRKAAYLLGNAADLPSPERELVKINAYALAASEENAAGGLVCTAPTLGSAGVIPGLLYYLSQDRGVDRVRLRNGLLAAAAVGYIIKHNASIAGAEVGCQGEIGSASAMAAALLAQIHGKSPEIMANAAEIALEHHLGLTCDPVMGFVQIPCIERNAMGAVKAYNAFLLASSGDSSRHKVQFDHVVEAMLATGRDMLDKYKETSLGGLAVSHVDC